MYILTCRVAAGLFLVDYSKLRLVTITLAINYELLTTVQVLTIINKTVVRS